MSSSLLFSSQEPGSTTTPPYAPSHLGEYCYSVAQMDVSELIARLQVTLEYLGIDSVHDKPFELKCAKWSTQNLFSIKIYKESDERLLLECQTESGDGLSFGFVVNDLTKTLTQNGTLSLIQVRQNARQEQMQRWEESARRTVIRYQMNMEQVPEPTLSPKTPKIQYHPASEEKKSIELPVCDSNINTVLLRRASYDMADSRSDALESLVAFSASGSYQTLSHYSNPNSDGAVDVSLGILRSFVVNQKHLLCYSFDIMRKCMTFVSNLIEYVQPGCFNPGEACPRLAISQYSASRLFSVGGFQSLIEALLYSFGECLVDERENSILVRAQFQRESMRAILACLRHIYILIEEKQDDNVKNVFKDAKLSLGKVLVKCNTQKDEIVKQLSTELAQVIVKVLKLTGEI